MVSSLTYLQYEKATEIVAICFANLTIDCNFHLSSFSFILLHAELNEDQSIIYGIAHQINKPLIPALGGTVPLLPTSAEYFRDFKGLKTSWGVHNTLSIHLTNRRNDMKQPLS